MGERVPYEEAIVLKEIAELLNEGTELSQVLSEVLEKLLQVTGFETGWIFLVDESGQPLFAASKALPPALTANGCSRMRKKHCWCLSRYQKGELRKATNIIQCHRIESAIEEGSGEHQGLTHHASVPLRAGEERFGVLNVGSPHKTHFQEDELALLESIAFQIGTALKRLKMTKKEQEIALAEERNRLASDLHDSVNQILFSLSLTARAGIEISDDVQVKETFQYMQGLSQKALGEMRALISELQPPDLNNGLAAALSDYARLLDLRLKVEASDIDLLPPKSAEALWRIGQEAMANCKKHAKTKQVSIRISESDDASIHMVIQDGGCGFNYEEGADLPTMGLKSMKYRAEKLGGCFSLKTAPGEGVTVEIRIPKKGES